MKNTDNKHWVALILSVIALSACQLTNKAEQNTNHKASVNRPSKTVKALPNEFQQVTVIYNRFEGGFYGLVTNDGRKLLPLNLDKRFQQDGAILQVKGTVDDNVMTIQQWGTPFTLSSVKLVKEGRKKVPVAK